MVANRDEGSSTALYGPPRYLFVVRDVPSTLIDFEYVSSWTYVLVLSELRATNPKEEWYGVISGWWPWIYADPQYALAAVSMLILQQFTSSRLGTLKLGENIRDNRQLGAKETAETYRKSNISNKKWFVRSTACTCTLTSYLIASNFYRFTEKCYRVRDYQLINLFINKFRYIMIYAEITILSTVKSRQMWIIYYLLSNITNVQIIFNF